MKRYDILFDLGPLATGAWLAGWAVLKIAGVN